MDQQGYVLIADDDAGIRGLVSTVLRDAGYPGRAARDGNEALFTSRAKRPIAAVLDYMMPGPSGIDVGVELRRLYGAELPLVFVSAITTQRTSSSASTPTCSSTSRSTSTTWCRRWPARCESRRHTLCCHETRTRVQTYRSRGTGSLAGSTYPRGLQPPHMKTDPRIEAADAVRPPGGTAGRHG